MFSSRITRRLAQGRPKVIIISTRDDVTGKPSLFVASRILSSEDQQHNSKFTMDLSENCDKKESGSGGVGADRVAILGNLGELWQASESFRKLLKVHVEKEKEKDKDKKAKKTCRASFCQSHE